MSCCLFPKLGCLAASTAWARGCTVSAVGVVTSVMPGSPSADVADVERLVVACGSRRPSGSSDCSGPGGLTVPGGTGGRTPQALAKAHERGAFGPEKTSTNAWMGHRAASTMACAYTSQNPSGYSLSLGWLRRMSLFPSQPSASRKGGVSSCVYRSYCCYKSSSIYYSAGECCG